MNVQSLKFKNHFSLRRKRPIRPKILGILLLILALSIADAVFAQENLIANPGFEEGSGNELADWTSFGDVEWVTDELHSGSRAIKVHANGGSSKIESSWFEGSPHVRVEVSAWLKAQNVVSPGSYFKLRMTLSAYEADQTTKIKHWDLVATTGSFEWKQVRASVIVPPDTKYMRLAVQLTECTGTVWVDDVAVKIAQTIPEVASAGSEVPIIIPQPWQMRVSKEKLSLGTIGIVSNRADETLKEAIAKYFNALNVSFLFVSADDSIAPFTTLLILGDESQPIIDERFQRLSSGSRWSDLGEEGYFLSVAKGQEVTIYVGANSEQGRFYALQTMKQLLLEDDKQIYVADIVDRPTLSRRGIPMGIQWYNQQAEVFKRLAELKLNFVLNLGTFENEKLWYRWREPLTESEKENLRDYLIFARKHFIRPYIAIGPRGRDASGPTYYSSPTDINLVVDKMALLYDLGVRDFGLTFDDLGNVGQDVLFGEDVAFFNNDIGAAHYYFVKEVHQRLKARHPDINLMVIPMIYNHLGNRGDTELSYLASMAQLSPEIEMYSSPTYPQDVLTASHLTNRRPLIWDNFWASFYQNKPAPEFVVPLERSGSFEQSLITGFTFLPLIPASEDASLVSWKTAADYAWAPERYNADASFQSAANQYMGGADKAGTLSSEVPQGEVTIETPIIALSMGTFIDSVRVELTTTTAGTTIHYTLDGTTPTSTSPRYIGAFTLTVSSRVKAKAFDGAYNDSGVVSAFLAISPAKSKLYLPIVQGQQPIETGFNSLEVDHDADKALVGIQSFQRSLNIGTLLLVIGISILIWHTTGDSEKEHNYNCQLDK
jgi:hypothetical protein